jgi:hypothetical protein
MTYSAGMPRQDPLVTIASFDTAFEASLARGALEAIGIRAYVPGEAQGAFSLNRGGAEYTALKVFEPDRDRAVVALRRMQMRLVDDPR